MKEKNERNNWNWMKMKRREKKRRFSSAIKYKSTIKER